MTTPVRDALPDGVPALTGDVLAIRGGRPLRGRVDVKGAKNLATKAMVASLLGETTSTLRDVPAISEALPGFSGDLWVAVYAPKGTPPAIVQRLHQAAVKGMNAPDVRERMANQAWLFDFVVDRASKNPALADTISSMFTDLDLREKLKRPGFYMDLLLGRSSVS